MLKQRVFLLRYCLGCSITLLTACFVADPPKPFSTEVSPTEAIAEITEIPSRPVWVKFINSSSDRPGELGVKIKVGESVRTAMNSRTQISLKNGVLVRLEGDSDLKINDKHQIQLIRGHIIAHAALKENLNTEIITVNAIAVLRNATVYIELPKANKEQQIFVLQGTVTMKLKNALEPIVLKTGQNLTIKSDGSVLPLTNTAKVALNKRFTKSKLLSGFQTKLPSQGRLEANLKISSVSETVKIPYNSDSERTESPSAYYEPNYYEPNYYEPSSNRSQARRDYRDQALPSTSNEPEPKYSIPEAAPLAQPIADPPPLPVQPEELPPLEAPPFIVNPEAESNPP